MATSSPLLRAQQLEKRYRSGAESLTIFSGVDLAVERGERLALIGESGAGKSTLLHLLGGLDKPSAGTVYFEDRDISNLDERALADFRNRHIGLVWQVHYLLPEFTALENVMMPMLVGGASHDAASRRAQALLEEVGLASRAHHRSGELSGGEQQRVSLARALVNQPALLLADEPTGNLDERTSESVFALLESLHQRHQLTSVLVTHNTGFARRCDRVLRMEGGGLSPVTN
ncbi:MAG TPA: ABC transporter ATP-binding protein [Solibacterales bacterium]|nr:ABC transporter ATP-binding protein [Bryobacterales bacterium]